MLDKIKRTLKYVSKNSLKFLSFFVALSLCVSMKYAAIGKYASYLQESTQVVAGESFFSSNLLEQVGSESDITKHESDSRLETGVGNSFYRIISSWDKYSVTQAVEIKNYNNTLKYNSDDKQNVYFYVKADTFSDEDCTIPLTHFDSTDADLTTAVSYVKIGNGYGQVGNITIGSVCYPVALLKGGTKQSQTVNITVKTQDEEHLADASEIYVKISAHMIPITSLSSISLLDRNDGIEVGYNSQASTSGIFYSMLGGIFCLGSQGASAEITCSAVDYPNTLKVIMRVACDSMEYMSSATARIYFKSDKLECGEAGYTAVGESSTGFYEEREKFFINNFTTSTMTPEEVATVTAGALDYDQYIEFTIQTGNLKELVFIKQAGEENFSMDDYKFGVVKEDE